MRLPRFSAITALLGLTGLVASSPGLATRDYGQAAPPNLNSLTKALSPKASISYNTTSAPRWSEFDAPQPGAIVNVATEKDVQTVVQYCLKNSIPFLAQNGAHGWQTEWSLNRNGIIINMRGLNAITFNKDLTQTTVQGGALIKEVVDTAYANNAQLLTGNCNCVGLLGAGLGGGYGNLMGMYGFSVDQYLALNVVLADGSAVTVTEKNNPDLWWALRGAGPNFGIVTSAIIRSKRVPKEVNKAWTGPLFFDESKLEQLVQAIQNLHLRPKMVIFLYFLTTGAPDNTPFIMTSVFYYGTEAEGREAFKPILDLGPSRDLTAYLPWNEWNAGGDGFCTKGGYKPSYGAGHEVMDPSAWRGVWQGYKDFVKNPGAGNSAVLAECYSHDNDKYGSSASFANRDVRFNSVIIPWYYDKAIEGKAIAFGSKARDLLRASDGYARNRTYINFAFGDETNEGVYGTSTARLRTLKTKYDRKNVFNHWFPIRT